MAWRECVCIFLRVSGILDSLRGLSELDISVYYVNSLGIFVVVVVMFKHRLKEVGFKSILLAISGDNPLSFFSMAEFIYMEFIYRMKYNF